jgi:hypothetical protein
MLARKGNLKGILFVAFGFFLKSQLEINYSIPLILLQCP